MDLIDGMPVPEDQLLSLDKFEHYDSPEGARAIYLDHAREGVIPHETMISEVSRREKVLDLRARLFHHDVVYHSKDLTDNASPTEHRQKGIYAAIVQEGLMDNRVRLMED